MKILVLGASGMLGNATMGVLSEKPDWQVFGTIRSEGARRFFPGHIAKRLVAGVDAENQDSMIKTFGNVDPDIVINCIGLVKQFEDAEDPLRAIPLNTLLPHRLAQLCAVTRARLIHFSTDCVFSGARGGYSEDDTPDAQDVYGRSKLLGEVVYPHTITLRTSIIGHELQSAHGLIGWFLSQKDSCKGYRKAIFSGLPTVALARIIRDIIIPRTDLHGVYHVGAASIAKYDLLKLVADVYGKAIEILPDDRVVIDRSLDSSRFCGATGYAPPDWPSLIRMMHQHHAAQSRG